MQMSHGLTTNVAHPKVAKNNVFSYSSKLSRIRFSHSLDLLNNLQSALTHTKKLSFEYGVVTLIVVVVLENKCLLGLARVCIHSLSAQIYRGLEFVTCSI